MSLYNVTMEYQLLASHIAELVNNGELNDERATEILQAHTETIEDAIAQAALESKNAASMAKAIRLEEIALSERRKNLEQTAENIKSGILKIMSIGKIVTVETSKVSIKLCKKPPRSDVIDESEIPRDFFITRLEEKLDKKFLLEQLKVRDIPGAKLIKDEKTLRIK